MKNTRLVYNDEKNLKIYQALSPEDFKEFFMTYLTYKTGSELQITDFNNPLLYALFLSFKDKIDYNEAKWEKQAAAKRENGKKGGRPRKNAEQTTPSSITDIPNNEFEIEQDNTHIMDKSNISDSKPSNTPQVSTIQQVEEKPIERPEITINREIKHIKVAASKQSPQLDIQDLLNSDDELYKYYNRYINAVVNHEATPTEITANTKEMAKVRLITTLDKYKVNLSSISEFINNDIDHIKRNTYVA